MSGLPTLRETAGELIKGTKRAQQDLQKDIFDARRRRSPLPDLYDFIGRKEGVPVRKKEEEPKPTIPAIDILFPLAAAPFLKDDEPITTAANEARIKILLMIAKGTLNRPQTLTDLLERGRLLSEADITAERFFGKTEEHYNELKKYLENHPDKSYLLLEDISVGAEESDDISVLLLRATSGIARGVDYLERLSQEARELYQQPPTLWPAVHAGRLDVDVLSHKLSFFTAHLARLEVSEEEAKEYLTACAESEKRSLQYQIGATLNPISLEDRYFDDGRVLPYSLKFVDIRNRFSQKEVINWLSGCPPRQVFQAVLERYQGILEGFGISLPRVQERRFDASVLAVPQVQQEAAADPQALLSLYKAKEAELVSFYAKRLPLISYILARTNLAAGATESGQSAADLISWLRQDGLNQIIIFADKERTDFYDIAKSKIERYGDLGLTEPKDWFVEIDEVLSLLYHYEDKILYTYDEKDNPIFALTKLVHPNFSLATLNIYPTVTGIIFKRMIKNGLLEKEKGAVFLAPKTPSLISLPFLAQLAGITEPEKIESFCQEFTQAVNNYISSARSRAFSHYVEAAKLQEDMKQALAQPEPKFGSHKAGFAPAALWFLPNGYGPYTASRRVILSDGSTAKRELALEGGEIEASALLDSLEGALGDLQRDLPGDYIYKLRQAWINRVWFDKSGGLDIAKQQLDETEAELEQVNAQIKEIEVKIAELRTQGVDVQKARLFFPVQQYPFGSPEQIREIKAQNLLREQGRLRFEKEGILSARQKNLQLVLNDPEKAFADPKLPVDRMAEVLIRPLLSSFTLSVLSTPQELDKNISQECFRGELEEFGVRDREDRMVITAKSLAAGRLLNIVKSLDNLMAKTPDWSQVDVLLGEAETVLRNFQEQMEREDLPSAETEVDLTLLQLPEPDFEKGIWSPEVSKPKVVAESAEEIEPKRPATVAEWKEIFARYSLEELRILRDTLQKEIIKERKAEKVVEKEPAGIRRIQILFDRLVGRDSKTKAELMTKADFERIIDFLSEIIEEKSQGGD